MKGNEMLDMIENLNPAYVEAAAAAPKAKHSTWLKRCGTVAACFVLMLSIGLGTYAYAAEVKEYNTAVQFFEEYDLPTEGLTREEIKKIYRDITTESFSYSKTAQVIANSLSSAQIEGFEILQGNPTPEDVQNLWRYKNYTGAFLDIPKESIEGIHYKERYEYTEYTPDTPTRFDMSYLEKYHGETLIWSAPISEFAVDGHVVVSDGVIAYGDTPAFSGLENSYAWMAKFDENGNLIWKKMMDHKFKYEYISTIFENADGSYDVISRAGHQHYVCLSKYSKEGQEFYFKKTEVDNNVIGNVVRLDAGYMVQLGSSQIVKMDAEGNITESSSYSSEDSHYHITNMIEFNGNVYLSAYAVPKPADGVVGVSEIANIMHYLRENNIQEISGEELTPIVRENYTALLFVCKPDTGTLQEFYSVKGSMGGELSLDDSGNLLWDVQSITTAFYSPMTSSFTIGGTCYVFQYTFNDSGILVGQEKTDMVTNYSKY